MDRSTFASLALTELAAVHRLAYHLSSSRQDVDDLVQETYLHALRAADQYQLKSCGIRPWLFKILHNVINARYGKQRRDEELLEGLRHGAHSGAQAAQAAQAAPSSDGPAQAEQARGPHPSLSGIAWDAVDQRLKRAIDDLPFSHKVVFLLSAVEGMRYREIAETVGVPVGTVMSRLHRARALLAAQLQELAAEQGMWRDKLPKREMNSSR